MTSIRNEGTGKTWKNTFLYEIISHKKSTETQRVLALLEIWMLDIEKILNVGGSTPKDFTLHDSGHSFRVSERMKELIPDESLELFSLYELTLLFLSAYLHDIGMTPEVKKVIDHRNYLITGEANDLTEKEIDKFQAWLDEQYDGLEPPISKEKPTTDLLNKCDEIITYYCRFSHNDWSETWIRNYFKEQENILFFGWVDKLVLLCKSHHFGYEKLKDNSFNLIFVEEPNQMINLRYLACILRVADILEFDPERTPDIIFKHRNIDSKSKIYWWKDQISSRKFHENRYEIYAEPADAKLQRAILDTIKSIEVELSLVYRLLEENLLFGIGKDNRKWIIKLDIKQNIVPKNNSFIYIDGSFRPNTSKLLEMLSGSQLYENKFDAVRELIQNSLDAVKEKIAYTRLLQNNPSDESWEEKLGAVHYVNLYIDKVGEDYYLICEDNGIGMSKNIIENHLLISGQPKKEELFNLERRCKKAGFRLERTGQFGIGVLSYFMIANEVEIQTVRAQETIDKEDHGWIFKTEGVGSFGELREDLELSVGTKIRLKLKQELIDNDYNKFLNELYEYIIKNICFTSCEFRLHDLINNKLLINQRYGWLKDNRKLLEILLLEDGTYSKPDNDEKNFYTKKDSEVSESKIVEEQNLINKAIEKVKWIKDEGKFEDCTGRYRIMIPYFELEGGNSLVFFDIDNLENKLKSNLLNDLTFFNPLDELRFSWCGVSVNVVDKFKDDNYYYDEISAFVEIDLTFLEQTTLSVNRSKMLSNKFLSTLVKKIEEKIEKLQANFINDNISSIYSFININFSRIKKIDINIKEFYWIVREENSTLINKIVPPIGISIGRISIDDLYFKNKKVLLISNFHINEAGKFEESLWNFNIFNLDKLVYHETEYHLPNFVGLIENKIRYNKDFSYKTIEFPPNWSELLYIAFSESIFWNNSHKLLLHNDLTSLICKCDSLRALPEENSIIFDKFISSKDYALEVFIEAITSYRFHKIFDWLEDKDENIIDYILEQVLNLNKDDKIKIINVEEHSEISYGEFSKEEVNGRIYTRELFKSGFLPDPGPDWTLQMKKK